MALSAVCNAKWTNKKWPFHKVTFFLQMVTIANLNTYPHTRTYVLQCTLHAIYTHRIAFFLLSFLNIMYKRHVHTGSNVSHAGENCNDASHTRIDRFTAPVTHTATARSAPQSCPPQTTTVKRTKIIQTPEHQKHPSHPLSSPQRKCNTNKLEAELNVPICTYFDLCNKGWTKELIGVLSAGKKREKTYTAVNIYRTLRFRL